MQTSNTIQQIGKAVLTMPEALRLFVIKEANNKSPYNGETTGSFYDCDDKSWDYTPDGSIRVSDHWNFYSRGKYHCLTDIPNERIEGKWVTARYNAATGLYHVIAIDEKDMTAYQLHNQRYSSKQEEIDYNSLAWKRQCKAEQIRKEKKAKIRAQKIRNGFMNLKGPRIWVEVTVNKWAGSGRRVKFDGTETILGYLTWESKTGNSFCIQTVTGYSREIRRYVDYKEFKRKPRN